MSSWREDPRLPYAIATVLGMIAGVAAKQAVALQSGQFPKPISIIADILVLGMIWLMAMYMHSKFPGITIEGIALLSAALAMWGPRGIAALLGKFKVGALAAAEQAARQMLPSVEPTHRPTVTEAIDREREEAVEYDNRPRTEGVYEQTHEDKVGRTAPIRKMRDVLGIEPNTPADEMTLLGKIDQVAPDYKPPNNGGDSAK
jgi:hypothetical protein